MLNRDTIVVDRKTNVLRVIARRIEKTALRERDTKKAVLLLGRADANYLEASEHFAHVNENQDLTLG